jgi:hypothetical protein
MREVEKLQGNRILSSMRSRVIAALPMMNSREKLIFGLSYNAGYGRMSTAIHYRAERSDYLLKDGAERESIGGVGLIAMTVLLRCYRLMGRPEAPIVAKLEEVSEQTDPKTLFKSVAALDAEVGDFVLARGDLAEIVGTHESKFGYKSYRVRYLAERPMPHILEDSFPVKYTKILYRRSELLKRMKQVQENAVQVDSPEHRDAFSWENTQANLRESVIREWKAGLGKKVRR